MKHITPVSNSKGFTLLELMSVLVIMGVLLSVNIKKFDLISDSASITAIKAGVRELNTQETLLVPGIKLQRRCHTPVCTLMNGSLFPVPLPRTTTNSAFG